MPEPTTAIVVLLILREVFGFLKWNNDRRNGGGIIAYQKKISNTLVDMKRDQRDLLAKHQTRAQLCAYEEDRRLVHSKLDRICE